MRRRAPASHGGGGRLRIIAGRWRGRRLPVPSVDGLRPTPGRVRETLFNWLAPVVPGARCLDLFAGSGLLGLEALSRGAASCVAVERDRVAVQALIAARELLGAGTLEVHAGDVFAWLAQASPEPFDLVFADPPFHADLCPRVLAALAHDRWLAPAARVYVESKRGLDEVSLPGGFRELRRCRAGEVTGQLLAWDEAVCKA